MWLHGLVILIDDDATAIVGLDANLLQRQVIGHALAASCKQHGVDSQAFPAFELAHDLAIIELVYRADLIIQAHVDITVAQVVDQFVDDFPGRRNPIRNHSTRAP